MVIPASMNQIHGGAQLIRLVLTSISALMIKTLQKALAQPDTFSRLGGLPSPAPHTTHGADSAMGRQCPKKVGRKLPGPQQQGDIPARPRAWQSLLPSCLAATAPEVFLGFAKKALTRIPGRGRQETAKREQRTPACATVGLGVLGTQTACLAMNN